MFNAKRLKAQSAAFQKDPLKSFQFDRVAEDMILYSTEMLKSSELLARLAG